jgi:hypothetical protein
MKRTPLNPGKPLQRKTPLRAKAGFKPKAKARAKREVPPHKQVGHERMRPKESADPTAEQRRYWAWLRDTKGCCITGALGCTIHHVTSDGHKRIARSHWQVVPLRADLHQTVWDNRNSVEAMGHAKFNAKHRVDLLALSAALVAEWRELGCP